MEKILFVDACVRGEASRTRRLCNTYIRELLNKHPEMELETVKLTNELCKPLTAEYIKRRNKYVSEKKWDHPMFALARQFKEADYIVMGTPYYDLSFSSILKVYIENIMVADLTFEATNTGFNGLCTGKKIVYITTAGGSIGEKNYGYDYICGIADMVGIPETELYKAEMLDIEGFDPEKFLATAEKEIKARAK